MRLDRLETLPPPLLLFPVIIRDNLRTFSDAPRNIPSLFGQSPIVPRSLFHALPVRRLGPMMNKKTPTPSGFSVPQRSRAIPVAAGAKPLSGELTAVKIRSWCPSIELSTLRVLRSIASLCGPIKTAVRRASREEGSILMPLLSAAPRKNYTHKSKALRNT